MTIVDGDTVTIEYTGRLDDGTVFDTSRGSVAAEHGLDEANPDREYTPLTVEVGSGRIIEGLEAGLRGMENGETDSIEVPPGEGYGEHTADRVVEYPTDEFAEMLGGETPREGMEVHTEEGLPGAVVAVDGDTVRVDFNHELAGETLTFEIEIVSVD